MTLTADTVLTFDFRSTREGEIHAIGFDDNDIITDGSSQAFFELFGTDANGLFNQTYNTYNLGDGWTRYEIPVGATFTGAVTDLFFTADDDAGADGISQFRNVSIYEANPTLTINEGGSIPLTNTNLNVFDTDTTAANITYNVTGTSNGEVRLNGVLSTSFTQDDINNNRVTFVHDGSETITADFDFTVNDGATTTVSKTLGFDITPINDDVVLTINTGANVIEGGNVTLTNTVLNITDPDNTADEITYTVSGISNGYIEVGGIQQNTFTQDDINNGIVVFWHDGSEAATSTFNLSVVDLTGMADTATFSMTVAGINDMPTDVLLSNYRIGETAVIGTMIGSLSTIDVDLPGDIFTYLIMNDPDGKFMIVGNELRLNAELRFGLAASHNVTIQTNDNNGGTFDRTFTIDVLAERSDFVPQISIENFGDVGRGLEEERRIFSSEKSQSIINNFIMEKSSANAFYGEGGIGEIIRQNTQFNNDFEFNDNLMSTIDLLPEGENNEVPVQNEDLKNTQRFTRMVDFLRTSNDFSPNEGNDDVKIEMAVTSIDETFDNITVYHQARAAQILKALQGGN